MWGLQFSAEFEWNEFLFLASSNNFQTTRKFKSSSEIRKSLDLFPYRRVNLNPLWNSYRFTAQCFLTYPDFSFIFCSVWPVDGSRHHQVLVQALCLPACSWGSNPRVFLQSSAGLCFLYLLETRFSFLSVFSVRPRYYNTHESQLRLLLGRTQSEEGMCDQNVQKALWLDDGWWNAPWES